MAARPGTLPQRAAERSPSTTGAPLRFVTATSLFDGHDAAINIMRRILQASGAEVIHLGHDRSAPEIVDAAIEEDADALAVSSYQGGHVEFFTYLVELLRERGRDDIRVFGGGGGTILDSEAELLHQRGVTRIYTVEEGRRLGLQGMIDDMMERTAPRRRQAPPIDRDALWRGEPGAVARLLTRLEELHDLLSRGGEAAAAAEEELVAWRHAFTAHVEGPRSPLLGITGVGGAGKSSLTDELLRRTLTAFPDRRIALVSVDPTRTLSGGALLGDRIRMNTASHPRTYMRSMATRRPSSDLPRCLGDTVFALQAAGFDLIVVETAGIGQGDAGIVELADVSLYVMTPEFGAPTQLEKIAMLDYADVVALNKADKRGAEDARRFVARQLQRNHRAFDVPLDEMPVIACIASRFGDPGVDRLFGTLMARLDEVSPRSWTVDPGPSFSADLEIVVPPRRARYLSEIADALRAYHDRCDRWCDLADRLDALDRAARDLADQKELAAALEQRRQHLAKQLPEEVAKSLEELPELRRRYEADTNCYIVRGRTIQVENFTETLAGTRVPKVALPRFRSAGDLLRWRLEENVPGAFPFTAGVFPFKRRGEDPTRMFAGEGTPERTNARFHYLAGGHGAARLSTAFDSVTLYGRDPHRRPDIYGKIGNSGVSVPTLDDAKRLYSGFDLTAPSTSVSMTINGPAPVLLAFFFNAAIDQQVEKVLRQTGRWDEASARIRAQLPHPLTYRADRLPPGHDGSGLGLLGITGDQVVEREEYERIKADVLSRVRGTVQADILKEDQAQNTCIFSTLFALKMMADIQAFMIREGVKNFYSVSISGYHIAEAGANPITQLAFTLANAFTYVEYYRARGMDVDAFARNLSFFFSNGLDAEYAVIGRVARRIWAIAMRDVYGAGERSQRLKYHIQTSGRSLHAQEMDFNDIRTTLQALYAIADNCNSLHTNAYDEAITTPTEASLRRALAIQLIINRELGLTRNENPFQGSYLIEELTRAVEAAVLEEFDRLTERGGVLGAMEIMYQRSKIQEESLRYEEAKHSGRLPIIGVNTFLPDDDAAKTELIPLSRSTQAEKEAQIEGVEQFKARHAAAAEVALDRLRRCARRGDNIFDELMETVKVCTLGQITNALFEVGGQYRRTM